MDFQLQDSRLGYLRVKKELTENSTIYYLYYPCNSLFECTPYVTNLIPGEYKFELFGASGGSSLFNSGGFGGYSVGYYKNNETTYAYFYVGGKGEDAENFFGLKQKTPGGYNGGGAGGYISYPLYSGGGGGGSTDIRIGVDLIESRIIVAAGGGGAGKGTNGANGGGIDGADAFTGYLNNQQVYGGYGGKANSGGTVYSQDFGATPGKLFYGGKGGGVGQDNSYVGGGGGSGYYGGGGGYGLANFNAAGAGGGGSGYIGGVSSSTELNIVTQTTSISHEGNGYIKITFFGRIEVANQCPSLVCRQPMKRNSYSYTTLAAIAVAGQ